jgi:hypothetical protein
MVVDDFNVECIPRAPAKTDSPLLVHADAVLPLPVTLELFQSVSRRDPQILKDGRCVQHPEFPKRNSLDTRPELPDGFTPKKALGVSVLEALDHTV